MVENHGPFPYERLNPVITTAILNEVVENLDTYESTTRLNTIHPDINMVTFTLASLRKTLTPSFNEKTYITGLETYLLARDAELGKPQEPYPLSEDAIEFVKQLLGTNNSTTFVKETRDLTEKISKAYQHDNTTIPAFEASSYPSIKAQIESRTRTFKNDFPRQQPFLAEYLEKGFYRKLRIDGDEREQLTSLATGMIDGYRMFRTVQENKFEEDFGKSSSRFKSFFKTQ